MNNIDRSQLKTPRTAAQGFTLIEILIVIALTAVLFALLIIPLVSALRYTRQAQLVTAAQDAARITKERITRELGSAVFVFDGTSHPFQVPVGTVQTAGDDKYTNFLDLQMLDKNGSSVVAHAYNAKLDFVLPKLNDANGNATVDPTTGQPIAYTQSQNGSAIISNPSLIFPLAAGTNATRYHVGLKDPTKPYNNTHEGKSVGSDDNTYILYRAEYQPYIYNKNSASNAPAVPVNMALFAVRPRLDANGQPLKDKSGNIIYLPELDDPDFFRFVGPADTNWLDDTHAHYPVQTDPTTITKTTPDGSMPHDYPDGSPEQHNYRVEKWQQISKAVIPGPNVDLLLLPHNADNTLAYDAGTSGPCTATACPATAHTGIAHDPVGGSYYPIANTSVTFRPATVSGNATPGTTSDYNSSGVVSVDQAGFTYIPTVYTATSQSWSLPFHVGVYPANFGTANASMYYDDTDQWMSGSPTFAPAVPGVSINPGDVIEYRTDGTSPTPVYDVTQGFPFTYNGTNYSVGGNQYVPMTVNPDTGTITFSAPSLPNGPGDRYTRSWGYGLLAAASASPTQAEIDARNKYGGVDPSGVLDLTLPATAVPPALKDSPLQGFHILTAGGNTRQTGDENAHIAPGSLRIMGPDQVPGPNLGQSVTYTETSPSVSVVGDNQFSVDYLHNTLQFSPDILKALQQNSASSVQVIYDYQANLTLTDVSRPYEFSGTTLPVTSGGQAIGTDNLYQPMQVKVDYQTRDLIDVNIGVRIYDISTNRAQVIPTETKIKIGNSNR